MTPPETHRDRVPDPDQTTSGVPISESVDGASLGHVSVPGMDAEVQSSPVVAAARVGSPADIDAEALSPLIECVQRTAGLPELWTAVFSSLRSSRWWRLPEVWLAQPGQQWVRVFWSHEAVQTERHSRPPEWLLQRLQQPELEWPSVEAVRRPGLGVAPWPDRVSVRLQLLPAISRTSPIPSSATAHTCGLLVAALERPFKTAESTSTVISEEAQGRPSATMPPRPDAALAAPSAITSSAQTSGLSSESGIEELEPEQAWAQLRVRAEWLSRALAQHEAQWNSQQAGRSLATGTSVATNLPLPVEPIRPETADDAAAVNRSATDGLDWLSAMLRCRSLPELAHAITETGRVALQANRICVLRVLPGGRCELLAASGVTEVDRRSTATRDLEAAAMQQLASTTPDHAADNQRIEWWRLNDDHGQALAVLQVEFPQGATDSSAGSSAVWSTTALAARQMNAWLPLVWQHVDQRHRRWWPWDTSARRSRRSVWKPAMVAGVLVCLGFALGLVRQTDSVVVEGELWPASRRQLFATRSGTIADVLVQERSVVQPGDVLLRLHDADLQRQWAVVSGECATLQKRLEAVRAARVTEGGTAASARRTAELAAEEQDLQQRLVGAQRQQQLLEEERQRCVITTPVAGHVLTADMVQRWLGKPVQLGEPLLSVGDPSGPWQVQLSIPERQWIRVCNGHVVDLVGRTVEVSLTSREPRVLAGEVTEVGAVVLRDPLGRPSLAVTATISSSVDVDFPAGSSVLVKVTGRRRSLAAIWFGELAAELRRLSWRLFSSTAA
jgi:hypothetical protein